MRPGSLSSPNSSNSTQPQCEVWGGGGGRQTDRERRGRQGYRQEESPKDGQRNRGSGGEWERGRDRLTKEGRQTDRLGGGGPLIDEQRQREGEEESGREADTGRRGRGSE